MVICTPRGSGGSGSSSSMNRIILAIVVVCHDIMLMMVDNFYVIRCFNIRTTNDC